MKKLLAHMGLIDTHRPVATDCGLVAHALLINTHLKLGVNERLRRVWRPCAPALCA